MHASQSQVQLGCANLIRLDFMLFDAWPQQALLYSFNRTRSLVLITTCIKKQVAYMNMQADYNIDRTGMQVCTDASIKHVRMSHHAVDSVRLRHDSARP